MTSKKFLSLGIMVFCTILLGVPVSLARPQTAQAAMRDDGYNFTISESFSSYVYGSTSPLIQAMLTVPSDSTDPVLINDIDGKQPYFYIAIDSVEFTGQCIGSDVAHSYHCELFPGSENTVLSAGSHTVQALFKSVSQSKTYTSNPLTLTVTKVTPTGVGMHDDFAYSGSFIVAGSSFTSAMILGVDTSIVTDWYTGSYSITFTGPQTYTQALTLDNEHKATFTFPSVSGTYQYQFAFGGSAMANPVTTSGTIKITAGDPVTFKLYSNPETSAPGATMTYDLVASWAAGLPTPTGAVRLLFDEKIYDPQVTDWLNLDSNGSALFQVTLDSSFDVSAATPIEVQYRGDFVYPSTTARVAFPITNPSNAATGSSPTQPTPTSSTATTTSTTATATPTVKATPTTAPSVTATSTAALTRTPTATATSGTTSTHHITTSGSSPLPGNLGGWVLGTCVPVTCCAGILGFGTWSKRKQRRKQDTSTTLASNSEIIEVHETDIEDTAVEEEAAFPVEL